MVLHLRTLLTLQIRGVLVRYRKVMGRDYQVDAEGCECARSAGPRPGQPQFHHLVELTWRQRMRIAYGSARGLK